MKSVLRSFYSVAIASAILASATLTGCSSNQGSGGSGLKGAGGSSASSSGGGNVIDVSGTAIPGSPFTVQETEGLTAPSPTPTPTPTLTTVPSSFSSSFDGVKKILRKLKRFELISSAYAASAPSTSPSLPVVPTSATAVYANWNIYPISTIVSQIQASMPATKFSALAASAASNCSNANLTAELAGTFKVKFTLVGTQYSFKYLPICKILSGQYSKVLLGSSNYGNVVFFADNTFPALNLSSAKLLHIKESSRIYFLVLDSGFPKIISVHLNQSTAVATASVVNPGLPPLSSVQGTQFSRVLKSHEDAIAAWKASVDPTNACAGNPSANANCTVLNAVANANSNYAFIGYHNTSTNISGAVYLVNLVTGIATNINLASNASYVNAIKTSLTWFSGATTSTLSY